jgi:hypothetical protein
MQPLSPFQHQVKFLNSGDLSSYSDFQNPTFCELEQIPTMACSSAVYLRCGVENSKTLKEYIFVACKTNSIQAGLRSIHHDPFPTRGSAHPGYVLQFINAAQSALVYSMLSIPGWIYIPEAFATKIISAASDGWTLRLPPTSPGMWIDPAFNFPSMLSSSASESAPETWPSLNLDGAQFLLHKPISTLPPLWAVTSTSSGSGPSSLMGPESKMKACWKRGTVKRHHTGHRQALFERFGVHFWDFLKTMTSEQFASCTLAQQTYINEQIARTPSVNK